MKKFGINDTDKVVEELLVVNKKLIYIAGASASGKTFFAEDLRKKLEAMGKKVATISSDDFYLDNTWLKSLLLGTFDHPSLIAYDELEAKIREYLQNGKVELPVYSFADSRRTSTRMLQGDFDYVIVEGLYTISLLPNSLDPYKIFVHSPSEDLIVRRLLRDPARVGEPVHAVVTVLGRVFPMRNVFGKKQYDNADIVVGNDYEVLEKEGKSFSYEEFFGDISTLGAIKKTTYNIEYAYNDASNQNGALHVVEIFESKGGLITGTALSQRKLSTSNDSQTKEITIPISKVSSAIELHQLAQLGDLRLQDITNKNVIIFQDGLIVEKVGEKLYIKKVL